MCVNIYIFGFFLAFFIKNKIHTLRRKQIILEIKTDKNFEKFFDPLQIKEPKQEFSLKDKYLMHTCLFLSLLKMQKKK